MLTEKEKEAVEKLDYFIYDISVEKFNDYKESSKVILNLVTKLQDEIIKLLKENRELTAITNNFISKDLIKNKIKKYYEYDKKYKTYTSDGRENFTFKYFYAKEFERLLKEGESNE